MIFPILFIYIINILFFYSIYKTYKIIPDQHKTFPNWFIWMMLIPFVGYIFMWMMLPFGVPGAIKRYFPDNTAVKSAGDTLFGLGLALVLIITCMSIFYITILFLPVVIFILLIIYWVKVVKVREIMIQAQAKKQLNA
ncbi:MAG: hypothetical protein AAGA27_04705 [Pseudomonadota bacterium]